MTDAGNDTSVQPLPRAPAPTPGAACGNCGTRLLGPHCHACGQPVTGLVRHFSSLVGDFLDSVFDLDSRTPRTLWPLFARPGHLSLEYFAGRRVRYVSPVRLFFFLAIVTFFVAQLLLSFGDGVIIETDTPQADAVSQAMTVDEVRARRDAAMQEARDARSGKQPAVGPDPALVALEVAIEKAAGDRIAALRQAERAGTPPPPPPAGDDSPTMSFNGRPWDPVHNRLEARWLPGFANDWLNAQAGRAQRNIARVRDEPDLLKDAALGAAPTALMLLLPVFALMLKLAYLFKHRLYMEHLIIALHSHAFLCLALLLVLVVAALERWLAPQPGPAHTAFLVVEGALWTWMPLYLLLMQKRIYGQGWVATLLKFSVLGISYSVLLSFAAAFVAIAGLVGV
ncbi:DUF3667 domain-containing protein [Luteimonas sp. MC1572]|uniref:DUF3667 domain-containing protein n=1 Tax=Luteimonas sp. MC1572 TaxID=2799325 RepID=UPI0018F0B7FF|nr:DUF3667 domain-containing protein [Luteimonas sp. MC1572]MBJ6981716.1 DUF3667 domain-containing protein [Luteimonas sp. MC1572]QQO03004.1 DUF3667 domain-containing protein [Luteimonas sp. MC1572]